MNTRILSSVLLFLTACPLGDCDHKVPDQVPITHAPLHPVINEISLDPPWIEIANPHASTLSLSGVRLIDHTGRELATLGGELAPKAYYVANADVLAERGGVGLENASGTLLDYVAWSSDGQSPEGPVHLRALQSGHFSSAPFLTHASETLALRWSLLAGESFGRDDVSQDTDSNTDFGLTGGSDALGPTPGAKNDHPLTDTLDEQDEPPLPTTQVRPGAKWTVMVFADGRDGEARAAEQKYLEALSAVGSTPNVRFVAQLGTTKRALRYELLQGLDWRKDAAVLPRTASRNPGEPQTLSDFIVWSRTHFPAEKYALIVVGHGRGWKGINIAGSGPSLSMSELSNAMGALGQSFDLTFLNSCLMGAVEVATQLSDRTRLLVASEEVLYAAFSYGGFARPLRNNPALSAAELGGLILQSYVAAMGAREARHTLALLDLQGLKALHTALNAFAAQLAVDMNDVKRRNVRDDNANVVFGTQARANAERFKDKNFKDLYDLASRTAQLPLNAAGLVPQVLAALATGGALVLGEAHGPGHPNAHGLTVHFPKNLLQSETAASGDDNGFDDPEPASHGYALDAAIRVPLLVGAKHARPDDPGFLFPIQSRWDELLHRFYKPTADACIERKGGCLSEVTLPLGERYRVSANGSSDGDPQGARMIERAYWDWDSAIDSPAPAPIYAENTRYDPCTEDCDRDGADSSTDDPDAEGLRLERLCTASATHSLSVWDEHHTNGKHHDEGPHNQGRHWLHYNVSQAEVSVQCVSDKTRTAFPESSFLAPGESTGIHVQVPGTAWSEVRVSIPPNLEASDVSCPDGAEICGYDASKRLVTWIGMVQQDQRPLLQFSLALPSDHPCPHAPITVPVQIGDEPHDFKLQVRCSP